MFPIGAEPSTHRIRFADVLGLGRPQLVVSPLIKSQGDGVRLTAFEIPKNPRTERWSATILDQSMNRMHNHWHVDWDRDGRIDTLTASAEGIHLVLREGLNSYHARISPGSEGDSPDASGAGEIKVGRLNTAGERYIASIEPMHGNQVVVYLAETSADGKETWRRSVIDDSLKRGHALWTADVDNDGIDELVAGHSDAGTGSIKGPGLFVYRRDDLQLNRWTKHIVDDGGIATEDACAADIDGDGRIDLVAGGRATHNLKLYLNRGK